MQPSDWVIRFSKLIKPSSTVLDLACGGGRHGRHFLEKGCAVTFLDQNLENVSDLKDHEGANLKQYDLENGSPWPFEPEQFDAIIVTNYLYRPLVDKFAPTLKEGGVLIYETFAIGNEKYGRPKNPDFLLKPDELYETYKSDLKIIAFEQGVQNDEKVIQRICAQKSEAFGTL